MAGHQPRHAERRGHHRGINTGASSWSNPAHDGTGAGLAALGGGAGDLVAQDQLRVLDIAITALVIAQRSAARADNNAMLNLAVHHLGVDPLPGY